MLELGTKAPDFSLLDVVKGKKRSLDELRGAKGTLVAFICNHCPYVIYIQEAFVELVEKYDEEGIATIAISSNDVDNYPADHPDKMKERAEELGMEFPYLYDETQEVAKAYKAECTPDLFLFDENMQLVYRGRFDAARPGNDKPITGEDLKNAFDALLKGKNIPEDQQVPSAGCNIKWK
jgi:peroxiredoxin